ncbi:hypothetical protein O3P69_012121 [Scylla paramamosain]|uniref:Sushi domain-containing protein n=1 Tax=Scylla paramamosain TaxID=85552 RepID=A0AAW0TCL1_SCYPA
MNISVIDEFINPYPAVSPDLHFFYTAPQSTRACPSGRATTLTLRCDPEQPGPNHGAWECVQGFQKVHYITPSHCRHEHAKEGRLVPCSVRLSFLVEVIVLSAVCVALLPCLLLFCLWKKNQRLEYKYMKLVAKESSKDGMMELPPAESCALDDGEEEEVQFSKQPPRGLLGKFKQHKVVCATDEEI